MSNSESGNPWWRLASVLACPSRRVTVRSESTGPWSIPYTFQYTMCIWSAPWGYLACSQCTYSRTHYCTAYHSRSCVLYVRLQMNYLCTYMLARPYLGQCWYGHLHLTWDVNQLLFYITKLTADTI